MKPTTRGFLSDVLGRAITDDDQKVTLTMANLARIVERAQAKAIAEAAKRAPTAAERIVEDARRVGGDKMAKVFADILKGGK